MKGQCEETEEEETPQRATGRAAALAVGLCVPSLVISVLLVDGTDICWVIGPAFLVLGIVFLPIAVLTAFVAWTLLRGPEPDYIAFVVCALFSAVLWAVLVFPLTCSLPGLVPWALPLNVLPLV